MEESALWCTCAMRACIVNISEMPMLAPMFLSRLKMPLACWMSAWRRLAMVSVVSGTKVKPIIRPLKKSGRMMLVCEMSRFSPEKNTRVMARPLKPTAIISLFPNFATSALIMLMAVIEPIPRGIMDMPLWKAG